MNSALSYSIRQDRRLKIFCGPTVHRWVKKDTSLFFLKKMRRQISQKKRKIDLSPTTFALSPRSIPHTVLFALPDSPHECINMTEQATLGATNICSPPSFEPCVVDLCMRYLPNPGTKRAPHTAAVLAARSFKQLVSVKPSVATKLLYAKDTLACF